MKARWASRCHPRRAALWTVLLFFAGLGLFAAAGPATDHGDVGAGEGPVWNARERYLLFTGGGRITRRDTNGNVRSFRDDAGGANGLLYDHQGRLVVCEAGRRRVTRTEADGSMVVLADRFEGKRFNTPNDLTIDSQGRIYFTDPRYGSRDTMEMTNAQGDRIEGVYRIDAPGQVTRVIESEVERPNGILVSAGDRHLYVADNNNNKVGGARILWRFELQPDGSVKPDSRKRIFDWGDGRGPDGLKMDPQGRLYVAAGLNKPNLPFENAGRYKGGIYVLNTEGRLLRFIPILTDEVTNCALGGERLDTLFVTAGGHLWSARLDETATRHREFPNSRGAHFRSGPDDSPHRK